MRNFNPLETSNPDFEILYRAILPKYFVDRSSMISGGPNSGKSVTSTAILVSIRDDVPMFKAYIGTDGMSNSSGSTGERFLEPALVDDEFTVEELKTILSQLKENTLLYKEINDLNNLKRIASHIQEYELCMQELNKTNRRILQEINDRADDEVDRIRHITNLEKRHEESELKMCKKLIKAKRNYLKQILTDPKDHKIIDYIDYSSRLLLYFDDVTSQLKTLIKGNKEGTKVLIEVMTNIRHILGTTVLALHDPLTLPVEVRTGMFNIIFTDRQSAERYFESPGNGYKGNKEFMKKVKWACEAVFKEGSDPRINPKKLWFVREEMCFYYTVATYHKNPKPYLSRPIRESIRANIAKKDRKSALDKLVEKKKKR